MTIEDWIEIPNKTQKSSLSFEKRIRLWVRFPFPQQIIEKYRGLLLIQDRIIGDLT